ncbi:MAG: hypothetical protein H7Z74_06480 [Anaerolineae bacterium]|nr:hypothetical protein [Gemmatimonadaceae bacterium]
MHVGIPQAPVEKRESLLLDVATLSFGGQTLRFFSDDPEVRFLVREPHTLFLKQNDARADCEVACAYGDATPSPAAADFDSGGIWELRLLPEGIEEVCFYTATAAGSRIPMIRLTLDADVSSVQLVHAAIRGDDRTISIGYPVDEYLMARLLGRSGGIILHACALLQDDEALVFMGHSGAGKSTMTALAEAAGAEVMSDDRTIIRVDDGVVMAWGTPWHGTYSKGSPISKPVKGIFLLVKADIDAVAPFEGARGFQEMLVRLIQPTVSRAEQHSSFATLERVMRLAAIAELRFQPSPAAYALALDYARSAW